jgi:hypothetical protein
MPSVGSGQVQNILGVITGTLMNFTSNGQPAFELAETVTGTSASLDLIFHSVGDRNLGAGSNIGDTDIWFRLLRSAATTAIFTVYQDWSPTSSSTSTSLTANPGGARSASGTTQVQFTALSDTAAFDYWAVGNEYEYAFIFVQGGTLRCLHFGVGPRLAPSGNDGVARIKTALTGSGAVTIELDRNISGSIGASGSVQPGQRVWIVPQSPDASALVDAAIDIVTVNSVYSGSSGADPNKINVATTTKTYDAGSLVGLFPASAFVTAHTAPNTTTIYFTNRIDGGFSAAASQTAVYSVLSTITESDFDPDASNVYYIFGEAIFSSQASFAGPRCNTSDVFAVCSLGTQANGDRMIVGDKYYFVFPTFTITAPLAGGCVVLGPIEL